MSLLYTHKMSNLITTQVLLANPKPDHLVSVKLFDLYHHHRGRVSFGKGEKMSIVFLSSEQQS